MRKSSGFTLIELIVIVVIIGIGMSAGIGGYTTQVRMSQLKRDGDRIVDDLDRAKQMTVSRDVQGKSCIQSLSYSVSFTEDSKDYRLIQNCDLTPFPLPVNHLDSAVSATTTSVHFTEPYGIASSGVTIFVKHPSLDKCVQVLVSPSGGPVTISEPQACS